MFTMEKKAWPSLGKFYLFYPLIFPKKQSTLSKKRANPKGLTSRARTLGHFGEREDVSPVYEDDFRVSWSPVSLLVYEKSRLEDTLILGQISHYFFAFVYCVISGRFNAPNKALLTQCCTVFLVKILSCYFDSFFSYQIR